MLILSHTPLPSLLASEHRHAEFPFINLDHFLPTQRRVFPSHVQINFHPGASIIPTRNRHEVITPLLVPCFQETGGFMLQATTAMAAFLPDRDWSTDGCWRLCLRQSYEDRGIKDLLCLGQRSWLWVGAGRWIWRLRDSIGFGWITRKWLRLLMFAIGIASWYIGPEGYKEGSVFTPPHK